MDDTDLGGLLALRELDGVGDKRAYELYRSFESIDALYAASEAAFEDFHYINCENIEAIEHLEDAAQSYQERFKQCRDDDIEVIGIDDERYPTQLRTYHSPPVIYAEGESSLLQKPSVSFAGSRDTDKRGLEWTRKVATQLAEDYVIVSGGAIGVDTAAHKGALDADGETVVVLGTGIQNWYPEENVNLFNKIVDRNGLLISHRPPEAPAARHGFLNRNKTNSGLSELLVVVATNGTGGTMSQYKDAVSQGTPVAVTSPEWGHKPVEGITQIIESEEVETVTTAREIRGLLDRKVKDRSETREQFSLNEW